MAKKKLACASCGGSMKPKMKKGGVAPKLFAAGIPYAAGSGNTDSKLGTMKKGGATRGATDCPKGQYWDGTACVSNASPKIAAGILGAGMTALGVRIGQNIKANQPIRKANRAAKKAAKTMENDIAKKKMGGVAKTKLASLAPPTNKITRADIIAGALKNKRKKK